MRPSNKNPQVVVLFDIDYTLFDLDKFKKKLFQEIAKKIDSDSKSDIEKILQDLYIASRRATGYFHPKIFIKDLIQKLNIKIEPDALAREIFKESVFLGNLYKETEYVLKILSKNKLLKIGIFSGGFKGFQTKKIKIIKDFLHKEHIHIFVFKEKELPSVIKKYKKGYKLYVVDDMYQILYAAKKINKKIFTIWIKRGRFADTQSDILGFVPDATILNLKEVIKLVQHPESSGQARG